MMLVAMTLCWGLSYVFMDICLEHMSPFMLNTYRFCIAFVLIAILFRKRVMKVNRITLKYSFLCAISLVVTYIGATYGVMHTTISNSGFLCAMTSIFNRSRFHSSADCAETHHGLSHRFDIRFGACVFSHSGGGNHE